MNILKDKVILGSFIVWLFHISAIIGISIGYQNWFIEKTPLNLVIVTVCFFWVFPIKSKRNLLLFLLFCFLGIFAEWLGVTYGLIFGSYSYGANFGPKILGVPWLIGVKWAMLTFVCSIIANQYVKNKWIASMFAALLMLLLDFFMEKSAPIFDFWEFKGGVAPLQNYIGWFGIALLFQFILNQKKPEGNIIFSYCVYFAQLLFFIYFFIWNS